jgi:hypothetical protein
MYCDFCGKNLPYNVKYCRHCGRHLKDRSGDTRPIPVIDETILCSMKQQTTAKTPWYKFNSSPKALHYRPKVWRIVVRLYSFAIITALVYILTTFKTIQEYQILTGIWGSLLAIYIWWKR